MPSVRSMFIRASVSFVCSNEQAYNAPQNALKRSSVLHEYYTRSIKQSATVVAIICLCLSPSPAPAIRRIVAQAQLLLCLPRFPERCSNHALI